MAHADVPDIPRQRDLRPPADATALIVVDMQNDFVDGLEPDRADRMIRKLRYDAFYGTPLDHLLRDLGIEHVVLMGTVANICVPHTAASAALRWYDVTLVEDAVSALTPFDLDASIPQLDFLYGGRIVRSADLSLDAAQVR